MFISIIQGLASQVNWPCVFTHILAAKLLLQLLRYESFVVVEVLLYVDLELDDIVQHPINFGM